MIRDLLAIVETGAASAPAIDAAILLAERSGASLGITAVTEKLLLMAMFDPLHVPWSDAAREEDHAAGLAAIRRQAAIAKVPVDVRGLCEEATVLPALADLQSRYADMILIGAADGWSHKRLRRQVIEATLLGAGAPVLVTPPGWAPAAFDHIVLGWNASPQAARAARELRHIAAPGATIDIVVVDDAAAIERRCPGNSIACHLAHHGFKAAIHPLASNGRAIADILQGFAADRRAALLAIGAYAHSRLRQTVLGASPARSSPHRYAPRFSSIEPAKPLGTSRIHHVLGQPHHPAETTGRASL